MKVETRRETENDPKTAKDGLRPFFTTFGTREPSFVKTRPDDAHVRTVRFDGSAVDKLYVWKGLWTQKNG